MTSSGTPLASRVAENRFCSHTVLLSCVGERSEWDQACRTLRNLGGRLRDNMSASKGCWLGVGTAVGRGVVTADPTRL